MAKKGYVFISYSSKDETFIKQLTGVMDNNNIPYWKAPEMIPAGSNYAKEIPKAISGCEVFMLVLSGTSQKSIWVEKELDLAICHRKTVIPVQIDETPLSDMYRFYLNNVQMILVDIKDNQAVDFTEIKERISRLLGTKSDVKEQRIEAGSAQEEYNVTTLTTGQSTATKEQHRRAVKRSNALRMNRIPFECESCGGEVKESWVGVYVCQKCGRENYDDFRKVRNYLEKVGAAPALIISRNTGVSVRTIEYFWNEEYLEIPKTLDIRMACGKCGAPIRTGYLCEMCKNDLTKQSNKDGKGVRHS